MSWPLPQDFNEAVQNPATAFASVALVEGHFDEALSSVLQLAVNLVGIVVAAAVSLMVSLRLRRRKRLGRALSSG